MMMMMSKQLAIVLALVSSCVLAVPQRRFGNGNGAARVAANGGGGGGGRSAGGADSAATIVRQEQQLNADGSYNFLYETSNGIKASEEGVPDGGAAMGEFSYTAPEGDKIQLSYVADQGGFQPQGAHLPVEPPAPEHVIKGLEDIRANPPKDPDFNAAFLDAVIARLKSLQG